MSTYIHYTQDQKCRARTTDIADLLKRDGEVLKRSGKEYQWRDGSNKVTIRGNLWYEEREFIFNETDKEIFLNLRRKPKLKNAHKKVEKGKPIWYNYL